MPDMTTRLARFQAVTSRQLPSHVFALNYPTVHLRDLRRLNHGVDTTETDNSATSDLGLYLAYAVQHVTSSRNDGLWGAR
jgi:hypothetical protein